MLLIESLFERSILLADLNVIAVSVWARAKGAFSIVAIIKAIRDTITIFRILQTREIASDFTEA